MKRLGAPLTLSTAEAVAQSDLATGRLKRVLEDCAEPDRSIRGDGERRLTAHLRPLRARSGEGLLN